MKQREIELETRGRAEHIVDLARRVPSDEAVLYVLGTLASVRADGERAGLAQGRAEMPTARPLDEWHEDHGPVLWWRLPVTEPPYAGTPLDDDFPEHMTHWTPIVEPANTSEGSDAG